MTFLQFCQGFQKMSEKMLVSKDVKSLYNSEVPKRYIFLRLALHLMPNSQTFAQWAF